MHNVLEGKQVVVMGLAGTRSIAWAIGETALQAGAKVIYATQDEARFRNVFVKRSLSLLNPPLKLEDRDIRVCDVTKDEDLAAFFGTIEKPIDGLVYSIAFADPQTVLQRNFLDAQRSSVLAAFDVSAVSFACTVKAAQDKLVRGSSVIAMTFDPQMVYPKYGWMGPAKAALEAIVRGIQDQLGPDGIRVNALSAGPLGTIATKFIPEAGDLGKTWERWAPLGWSYNDSRWAVAKGAVYLLSDLSEGQGGTTHIVDGGMNATRYSIRDLKPPSEPV